MKKSHLWIYRISTGLISVMLVMGASRYILSNEEVQAAFVSLGFPVYLIYPMAIAKFLGVAALWVKGPTWLRDWAYAGIFFNLLLAASAHMNVGDGEAPFAFIGLAILCTSFFFHRKKLSATT